MNNQASWTNTGGNSWTDANVTGVSMSGTVTGPNPTTYSLTFIYADFYSNGYTVNGTLTFTDNEYSSSSNGTLTTAGNLTFSGPGGTVTSQAWNVSWTSAAAMNWSSRPPMNWTGTITSNGTAFDAKTLGF